MKNQREWKFREVLWKTASARDRRKWKFREVRSLSLNGQHEKYYEK